MGAAVPRDKIYTIEYIINLPDGERAELIDGQLFNMASPNTRHQRISFNLALKISNYINNGSCEVFLAPFAVFIKQDDINYVEPDISVICDASKIDDKGCHGAPDWIIEITSPSNAGYDFITKLSLYKSAGVKEYWIVHPQENIIYVYYFAEDEYIPHTYTFKDKVNSYLFEGLTIDFSEIRI